MGLHNILKKLKQKEHEVRLLMLSITMLEVGEPSNSLVSAINDSVSASQDEGLDNAGKTTVVKRFCGEDINSISPTYGFNIKTVEHEVDKYEYKLNIWDVGGQSSLRSYWRNYFECTDGLIWVVDSADADRLKDCQEELKKLLEEERLAGATLLVFANKQDLPEALSVEQIKDILDLNSLKTHHWYILPCSAVTGENLVDGMDWLIRDIAARIFTLE